METFTLIFVLCPLIFARVSRYEEWQNKEQSSKNKVQNSLFPFQFPGFHAKLRKLLQQVKLSKSNPGGDTLLRGIFHTKNLDEILASVGGPQFGLKRTLTAFSVTLIGIGAIIGAGIFATVGTAASGTPERAGAGPSLMLSFVITAIVCGFTALCYAELASMVPISGSAYTYSYATLGELVAWIIGWDLIIEYAIGNVAVAISWA